MLEKNPPSVKSTERVLMHQKFNETNGKQKYNCLKRGSLVSWEGGQISHRKRDLFLTALDLSTDLQTSPGTISMPENLLRPVIAHVTKLSCDTIS